MIAFRDIVSALLLEFRVSDLAFFAFNITFALSSLLEFLNVSLSPVSTTLSLLDTRLDDRTQFISQRRSGSLRRERTRRRFVLFLVFVSDSVFVFCLFLFFIRRRVGGEGGLATKTFLFHLLLEAFLFVLTKTTTKFFLLKTDALEFRELRLGINDLMDDLDLFLLHERIDPQDVVGHSIDQGRHHRVIKGRNCPHSVLIELSLFFFIITLILIFVLISVLVVLLVFRGRRGKRREGEDVAEVETTRRKLEEKEPATVFIVLGSNKNKRLWVPTAPRSNHLHLCCLVVLEHKLHRDRRSGGLGIRGREDGLDVLGEEDGRDGIRREEAISLPDFLPVDGDERRIAVEDLRKGFESERQDMVIKDMSIQIITPQISWETK